MPKSLAHQETFPYDVLDEIFCFACENRLRRALDLGRVCRFWYERFVRNDRMWAQMSHAVVKIPRPRKGELNSYAGVRRAMEVANQLAPIRAETLHPINQCPNFNDTTIDIEDAAAPLGIDKINSVHLTFRCPLVLEALTLVEPGVAACHICNKRVYKVRNQQELGLRIRNGDCVWMERKDLDPEADIQIDIEVAVFCEDSQQLLQALSSVAGDSRVHSRSTSLYPLLVVEIETGRSNVRLRLHSVLVSPAATAPAGIQSSGVLLHTQRRDPLPKRFTALWFLSPRYLSSDQQSTWQPNLQGLEGRFLSLLSESFRSRRSQGEARTMSDLLNVNELFSSTPCIRDGSSAQFLDALLSFVPSQSSLAELALEGDPMEIVGKAGPPPSDIHKQESKLSKKCTIQ